MKPKTIRLILIISVIIVIGASTPILKLITPLAELVIAITVIYYILRFVRGIKGDMAKKK